VNAIVGDARFATNVITIERECFLCFSWEARGVLRRAQRDGNVVVLPTGRMTTVSRGMTFTRRGARRSAERALRRWT
jgi:metallophosphoesterase superfamily enzyme